MNMIEKNKGFASKKVIIAIAVVAVFVLLIVLLTSVLGGKKIDLKKYTTVTYGDYNGYATAKIEISDEMESLVDQKKFKKYISKFDINREENFDLYYESLEWNSILDFIVIGFEGENSNLSNGDEIVVTVKLNSYIEDELGITLKDFCKGVGIKFANNNYKVKVENLPEANIFDATELVPDNIIVGYYTNVEYDRTAPIDGYADPLVGDYEGETFQYKDFYCTFSHCYMYFFTIDILYDNKKIAEIEYALRPEDDDRYLTTGEKIKIGVYDFDKENIEELGYVVVNGERTFTTSTLPKIVEYDKKYDDEIIKSASDLAKNETKGDFCSVYIATIKPSGEIKDIAKQNVVLITEKSGFFTTDWYAYSGVLTEDSEGKMVISWRNPKYLYESSSSSEEDLLDSEWSGYTFEKIS